MPEQAAPAASAATPSSSAAPANPPSLGDELRALDLKCLEAGLGGLAGVLAQMIRDRYGPSALA